MTRTLLLPFPPTLNNYRVPMTFGNGRGVQKPVTRLVTSAAGREYVQQALACIPAAPPMVGRLKVSVMLHAATNRNYDCDNFLKAILDSLTEANVWQDDSQIDWLDVRRGEKRAGGEVLVLVEELP